MWDAVKNDYKKSSAESITVTVSEKKYWNLLFTLLNDEKNEEKINCYFSFLVLSYRIVVDGIDKSIWQKDKCPSSSYYTSIFTRGVHYLTDFDGLFLKA